MYEKRENLSPLFVSIYRNSVRRLIALLIRSEENHKKNPTLVDSR